MKIRFKLIASLVLILLIPVIILTNILSSAFSDKYVVSQFSSLTNINSCKAAYIDEVISNSIAQLRYFTSDDKIRSFAGMYAAGETDEELEEYTTTLIRDLVKKSDHIRDMVLIGEDGIIISAYDRAVQGTYFEDATELSAMVSKSSGISSFYPPSGGKTCYFYAVRRVYSDTNKKVGYVCQTISVEKLTDNLKLSGFSNYGTTMIIDSSGRYITGSVSTPKKLEDISEYRSIKDHLSEVIPFYGGSSVNKTVTATYDYFDVCGTIVPSANWSVVSVFDHDSAGKNAGFSTRSVIASLIIVTLICIAAIVFICIYFTEPIFQMLQIISRQNNGDEYARLRQGPNDEQGEIMEHFNTMLDKISESNQRYKAVVSMSDQVVFEVNLKTFKVYTSPSFNQKFSFRANDDTINESFLYKMKVHKDDSSRYRADLDQVVSSSGVKWEGEYRFKNIYGDFSWIRVKGVKLLDRNNFPVKIIGTLTDIDREKKSTINLMQKANFDALTQLHNRSSFLKALDEEMIAAVPRKSLDALMFIDLDDFKHFNDEFGHKCGDEVLKFVADTIKEITFDKGFGGRLGGDEFVMCLTNLKLIGDAGKAAAEVISILDQGFISESCGEKFNIHCSIGIAFFHENGQNSTELLESADTAMYKIKKTGKSNFAYAGSDSDIDLHGNENMHPSEATFDNTFLR